MIWQTYCQKFGGFLFLEHSVYFISADRGRNCFISVLFSSSYSWSETKR